MASPFQIDVIRSGAWVHPLPPNLGSTTDLAFRRAVKETTRAVATRALEVMQRSISQNELDGPNTNSPMTSIILRARRRLGGKYSYSGRTTPRSPLFRNGQILRSLRLIDMRNGDFFVGITQNKKIAAGYDRRTTPLAKIAAINEAGATIRVTSRMNHFFHKHLRPASGGQIRAPMVGSTIVIPPRSFRTPVIRAFDQTGFGDGLIIERRAEEAFKAALNSNRAFRRFFGRIA